MARKVTLVFGLLICLATLNMADDIELLEYEGGDYDVYSDHGQDNEDIVDTHNDGHDNLEPSHLDNDDANSIHDFDQYKHYFRNGGSIPLPRAVLVTLATVGLALARA
uniref:Secreted protein n=1 Tax=Pseudodiaptomus poplesia TaxID=213370 RepID=A0A0U2UFY8_9MAXI|nr:hypothetical protein [Pseudodiaptomus poplesia]